jgi:hypothetical protein
MSDTTPAPIDWARKLVAEQAWVMHIRTGTVGRVARFFDGEGHVYEPKVDAAESSFSSGMALIELDQGDSFDATADQFMRLSEAEQRFYAAAVEGVRNFTHELARFAVSAGIGKMLFENLVGAAYRGQLGALERERPGRHHETPTDPAPAA